MGRGGVPVLTRSLPLHSPDAHGRQERPLGGADPSEGNVSIVTSPRTQLGENKAVTHRSGPGAPEVQGGRPGTSRTRGKKSPLSLTLWYLSRGG